ncbi:MAG: nitrate ABC transporter permease [Acidobacteria bacterium]|nr:MAG: nitrate ABC transporter permease [Acidobacteriota bacterium]
MTDLAAAFLPNRAVSKTTMRVIIVAQVALALMAWWLSPFAVLPRPLEVFRALRSLWFEQGLGPELVTSFIMNLQALGLTILISLGLSYLTVLPAFRPLATAISKGRFLGLIGLTFAFTLIIGGGHSLKVSLLVFGMVVFFVTSMAAIVAEIPKDRFDHARTLRMSEWRVVWEQNAAIGWMMLTMVEGISRAEGGIGAMLLNQNKHFRLAEVFAIQLVILTVGLGQDYGIGILKRMICPYSEIRLERK